MSNNRTSNVRFYKEKLPKPGDCVMVCVGKTTKLGVRVKLLEYGRVDGLVLDGYVGDGFVDMKDNARHGSRSVRATVREGKNDAVKVLSISPETGLIELSKRQVTSAEHGRCERDFYEVKTADAVLRYVSYETHIPVAQLYKDIGWPLAEKYGSLWVAFVVSKKNKKVWQDIDFTTPEVYFLLTGYIARRLTPFKLRAELRIECRSYNGIDAIKDALFAGRALSTVVVPIKICVVASPLYAITTEGYSDFAQGLITLRRAIKVIAASIEAEKGTCFLTKGPVVMSPEGDKEFDGRMTLVSEEGNVCNDPLGGHVRRILAKRAEVEEIDYGVDVLFGED